MPRTPLPEFDGEHSRAWWRAIAIAHLQQQPKPAAHRIAEQIRQRRQVAAQPSTCESKTTPANQPAGGTKP